MTISRRTFIKSTIGFTAGFSLSPLLLSYASSMSRRNNIREFRFTAVKSPVNLGSGSDFIAWTYNGQIPGPEIRVKENDVIRVIVTNNLPEETSIHWHGIPLPNQMDGVPGLTQAGIKPGESFTYEFIAKPTGTFIYHSHVGYQLDQGLYGVLIIEPRNEPRSYDQEYTLTLEDWVMRDDGGTAKIMRRDPMGPQNRHWDRGRVMGGPDWQKDGVNLLEPIYDNYAINGTVFPAVQPIRVRKGDRVRLRIANVSSSSIYTLRLAGHTMSITHTDGNPIRPVEVDVLRIAMGERYDVEFDAINPGRWFLSARDNGFNENKLRIPFLYRGISSGEPVMPTFDKNLRMADYMNLEALEPEPGPPNLKEGIIYQRLRWREKSPHWLINEEAYPETEKIIVQRGNWVHLDYYNHTPMPHPMHLHGHFFRIVNPKLSPERWIKKDTFVFDRLQFMNIEFLADNPGRWFHHCHNLYHMVDGMANEVSYLDSNTNQ